MGIALKSDRDGETGSGRRSPEQVTDPITNCRDHCNSSFPPASELIDDEYTYHPR